MKWKVYLTGTALVLFTLLVINGTAQSQYATVKQKNNSDTIPAQRYKKTLDSTKCVRRSVKELKQLEKEQLKNDLSELKEYERFMDDLQRDGLIDRKKYFTIEHKNGELFINQTKQPVEVYNKYRGFLEKYKAPSIKQDGRGLNIQRS